MRRENLVGFVSVLLVACAAPSSPTPAPPKPTTQPKPAVVQTFTPSPQPATAVPPSSPTRSSAPPVPTYTVQPVKVTITNTGGDGAFIRRSPSLEDRIKAWPDGTVLVVVGPDVVVNKLVWKRVRDPDGSEGWIPAQYTKGQPPNPDTLVVNPPSKSSVPAPTPAPAKPAVMPTPTFVRLAPPEAATTTVVAGLLSTSYTLTEQTLEAYLLGDGKEGTWNPDSGISCNLFGFSTIKFGVKGQMQIQDSVTKAWFTGLEYSYFAGNKIRFLMDKISLFDVVLVDRQTFVVLNPNNPTTGCVFHKTK